MDDRWTRPWEIGCSCSTSRRGQSSLNSPISPARVLARATLPGDSLAKRFTDIKDEMLRRGRSIIGLAISPDGRFIYVGTGPSPGEVLRFSIDTSGPDLDVLRWRSTLLSMPVNKPNDPFHDEPRDIAVTPDGRTLYGSRWSSVRVVCIRRVVASSRDNCGFLNQP